jgi:hypothetical protein
MSVSLINALRAAETLAAFHQQQRAHRGDEYDIEMAERCEKDAALIKDVLLDYDITPENQAERLRQHDIATAQAIVEQRVPPKWRASEEAPRVLEALARDIAEALQAARGEG